MLPMVEAPFTPNFVWKVLLTELMVCVALSLRIFMAHPDNIKGGIDIVSTAVVNTDRERQQLEHQGFRATPLDAIDALEAEQLEHATLAAEREHEKTHKLSPKARAEVTAAEDAAGSVHLPTIAETPVRRRGRPKHKAEETN